MFKIHTLKNGLRIILVPMAGVKSIAIGAFVGTGSRYETLKLNGISHFIEHMAFKGTKNYPTTKDTSRLEGMGAIQNAWTDVDTTCYYCKIPSDRWLEAFDLIKDLALYPQFPKIDLETERGVIIEEIRMYKDKPEYLVGKLFKKLLFNTHPLSQEVIGNEDNIKALNRADFVSYHQSNYVSANIILCLAGDIPNQALTHIESVLSALPKTVNSKTAGDYLPEVGLKVEVEKNLKIKQAHLILGGLGFSSSDSHRFASSLLFSVLGQGMSSRLFSELREKQGVCYTISASEERYPDLGFWEIYAGLNVIKLEKAIAGIMTQLKLVRTHGIAEDELKQAKEKARGALLFAQENPIRQMDFYAHQVFDRPNEILDYEAVLAKIMTVTLEEVSQVAENLFQTSKLNLAVVGPIEPKIKQDLVKLIEI